TRPSRGPWPCRIGTARPRAKLPGYACIIASTRRAASAAPNCANRRGRHRGAWLAVAAADMCASSPFSSLLLLLLAAGCNDSPHTLATRAALDAPAVGVVDGLTKIRPDFAVPPSTTTSIEAARNEFEPFQIAVAGGASGVKGLTAVASELVGPAGARIPAADVRFFQEGLYHVNYASNVEGAAGDWPDPLIPDVDAYFGEKRNGLPFDVAAATTRAIWVEVFVPRGLAAGVYTGTVTVSAAQGLPSPVAVAVSLRVRDFELPSTSSLKSAF